MINFNKLLMFVVAVFAFVGIIGSVSAGIVTTGTYSLKVNVYDYSTSQSITADSICVDGSCVYNKQSYTFSVEEGYHTIFVGESNYNSYSTSIYVLSNTMKNVYLTGGGGTPSETHSVTVNVYDYDTNNVVYADDICMDSHCVQNKYSYTFSVDEGYHQITVGDVDYESYTTSIYVLSDTTQNVYLDRVYCGGCGPVCGNGICETGENQYNCPQDCGGCGPDCDPGYLNDYKCSGNWVQRLYQNSDCSTEWKNWEYCDHGCTNGQCIVPQTCDPGYLEDYRCSGNWKQRLYQNSDCSTEWKNWEYCDCGCENGECSTCVDCDVEVYDLTFSDNPVQEGDDVDVQIYVKNTGSETETITVRFYFRGNLEDVKEISLDSDERQRVSFNLNNGEYSGYVKIEAETCEDVKDSVSMRLRIEEIDDGDGNLKIHVRKGLNCDCGCDCDDCDSDCGGDCGCGYTCGSCGCDRDLQGAKVKIELEDDDYSTYKYTDSDGDAEFYNVPVGDYEVTVTKSGYSTRKIDADVEEDETTSETVTLDCCTDTGCSYHDLEVRRIELPDEIHAGDEIDIEVKVRNEGDCRERNVKVVVKAFGQTKTSSLFSLSANSEKVVVLEFNVPSTAYGTYNVEAEACSSNDCDELNTDVYVSDVSAILKLDPYTVHVGEEVHVYGYVKGKSSASLYVDNKYVKKVYMDSTGHYSTYITPEEPGRVPVTLKDSSFTVSKTLNVVADLWVKDIEVKDLVATNEVFTVCADIETTKTGYVNVGLYIDGVKVAQKRPYISNEGKVCFETKILEKGDKEIKILAVQDDNEDGASEIIEVIKPDVEVLVIPKDLMIERGGSGLLKVVVTNFDPVEKEYNVYLEEIDWVSIDVPVDSAKLSQGQSKTFYVHINPHKQGEYESTVIVTANNVLIKETPISLYTAQEKENVCAICAFFARAGKNVGSLIGLIVLGIVAIIIIVAVLYFGFFRIRPLEPHYKSTTNEYSRVGKTDSYLNFVTHWVL